MKHWAVFSGVCLVLVSVSCGEEARDFRAATPGEAGTAGDTDAGADGKPGGAGGETPNTSGDAGSDQIGGQGGLVNAGAAGANAGGANAGTANAGTANSGGANAGTGGTNGGSAGGGGAGLVVCNTVPHLGQTFTTSANRAAPAPVLTQGTIQPGLYLQTAQANYGANAPDPQSGTGSTVRITVVAQTATLQFDSLESTLPETMQIVMGQPATAVPQSIEIICEPADVLTPLNTPITSIAYQASDTQFQLESSGPSESSLNTFTLQAGQ